MQAYIIALMITLLQSSTIIRAFSPRIIATTTTTSFTSLNYQRQSKLMSTTIDPTDAADTTYNNGVTSSAKAFNKPERVVVNNLPELYVYDHCPFCVRVRFAFGVKNIKHRLHFLANDDVETPTNLIGKKIAPILAWNKDTTTDNETNQHEQDNDNLIRMPESMDIINFVESDNTFGPTNVLQPTSDRTDLQDWQKSVRDLLRGLQRPRYVATGLLPEFQQLDGRHAFIRNHQMPPYSKDEWKAMDMTEKLAVYAECMAKDPAADIEELNRKLVELDDIVYSEHYCSPNGLSLDDVDLFSRLRSITIIRDVEWPAKLRKYMDNMAELGDVPLYDEMAL